MIQIRLQKQFCLITYYRVFQSAGSGRLRRPSLIQGHTTEPPRQTAQLPAFEEDDGDNEYYQYLEVFIDIDCGDYQDDGDLFRGIKIYLSGLQFSTNLLVTFVFLCIMYEYICVLCVYLSMYKVFFKLLVTVRGLRGSGVGKKAWRRQKAALGLNYKSGNMAKTNLKIWPKAILKKMEGKMESISNCELWTIKKIWRKNVKVGIFPNIGTFQSLHLK